MTASAGDLPSISVSDPVSDQVDAAIEALAAAGTLYERGNQLVEVLVDERTPARGHRTDPARAVAVTAYRVMELAEQAARWVKWSKDAETGQWVVEDSTPSRRVVQTLLDRQRWPMPSLHGIVETPFVRMDGTIAAHDGTGFDASTGYFCALPRGLELDVPDHPRFEDAEAAMGLLLELLADFPFEHAHHRSCTLAALLTLVSRPAIAGPVPMFIITSSTPGSGKTLLVQVLHEVAYGRGVHPTAFPEREDELEKRITSTLMAGHNTACWDNVDGTFGSAAIDALLTSTRWMGRELGRSHMVTVPARTIWFATGNNMRIKGDLARRVVPVRLEPGVERPEDRTGFRTPRIVEHVREHRGLYLSCVLTMIRAYLLDTTEVERRALPGYGSFEDWSALIRGCMVWLGQPDPLDAARAWAEESDEKRELYLALAAAWWDVVGSSPVRLADLPHMAEANEHRRPLLDALRGLAGRGQGIDTRLLGNLLRRERGRVFGAYRWDYAEGRTHGTRRWQLHRRTMQGGPGD